MSMRILIVEDDEVLQSVLLRAAQSNHCYAEGVSSAESALERVRQEPFDMVITDVTLPGMSGLDLLPHLQQLQPSIISIVMTAYGTIDTAVEAMKRGANDFLSKPFKLDTFTSLIRVAARRASNARSLKKDDTCDDANASDQIPSIIATAPSMRKLLDQVIAVAPFNTTVLVTGETGTGKELVARAVHERSPRSNRPLVSLNCAAVPEQLLEDELFGHVRGAFTGAQNAREGRFEQADGGTLFLDEIADMSLPLQSKLLRVLQEREFEKLGSSRTIKVDVRIIAATSANLEERIAEGSFRPDLYYRLNVVHLRLPALRERPEDVHPLANRLLARFCESAGLPPKVIEPEAWTYLTSYSWPGNVRQLQNAMERAAALTGFAPTIRLCDLPEEVRRAAVIHDNSSTTQIQDTAAGAVSAVPRPTIPDEGLNFDQVVMKLERDLLLQSLVKTGGNKVQAAKLLNMKRTTFVEKLKRLGINTEDETDMVPTS